MQGASERRETIRIPVHLQATLNVRAHNEGEDHWVPLPVLVREVSPSGVSVVLSEGEMPRRGLAAIVASLELERGDPVGLQMQIGELSLTFPGSVKWRHLGGGGRLPVRWTVGIDVGGTLAQARQVLGNWVFIAKDAIDEACVYAFQGAWEEARLLLEELGLHVLPNNVLLAILEEYRARETPTTFFPFVVGTEERSEITTA